MLCDNGTAFTHQYLHPTAGPSRFTEAVTEAVTARGTRLIHSSPYHPQTCGKVERHHQTLKQWLHTHYTDRPAPRTLRALQRVLDTYRAYYNTQRRHSAIGRRTPDQAWTNATSHGGPTHLPQQADATVHHPLVSTDGKVSIGPYRFSIGTAHRATTVTAIRDHHRITVYTPHGQPITTVTIPAKPGYIKKSR